MILNTTTCTHIFIDKDHHSRYYSNISNFKDFYPTIITASLLPKTLLPSSGLPVLGKKSKCFSSNGWKNSSCITIRRSRITASLIEAPLLWAGRVCIFYALVKTGLAGSPSNPLCNTTELERGGDDLGFSMWFKDFRANPEKEAADKRKFVSKWHPTTKGTLKRSYRVPSNSEGRRLLKAIASLLSEDDDFVDATSHKGCQIRRESAHGETVCCNNVRALFDELPTPHLVVEITPFPVGPLTENDYAKAEKLEKVLRTGTSI